MSDITTTLPPPAPMITGEGGPTVRPRRSLPGGRAVVGAFLVILAAVGTFGAYLQATAEPTTSYLVATRAFAVGDVLTTDDVAGANPAFAFVAMDLPPEQAASLYSRDGFNAEALLGAVIAAPVQRNGLFPRSAAVSAQEGLGVSLSFSLPSDRALNGSLKRSERVDIIATFPTSGDRTTETRIVARDVVIIATSSGEDGIGGGRVSLTVQVPDLATAQLLQHAVDIAKIAIVRGADASSRTPSPTATDTGDATPSETAAPAPTPAPAPAPSAADGGA